jgi:hypothetical protein
VTCEPGQIACEIARLVTATEKPTFFDWITFFVSVAATLATVFVGIAALRVSVSANRFAAQSRKDDLERDEREIRRGIAIDVQKWATDDALPSPPPDHWTALEQLGVRVSLAGYPEIIEALKFVSAYRAGLDEDPGTADTRDHSMALARFVLNSATTTWVHDPVAGKKALLSLSVFLDDGNGQK